MAVTEKKCPECCHPLPGAGGNTPAFSHLRVQLETGRTHQIRVHMAYLGHPVAGDLVYGPKKA